MRENVFKKDFLAIKQQRTHIKFKQYIILHRTYKEICDKHDPNYYKEFKAWADRYFVIQHRNETRGFGGIFFDDQNEKDPEDICAFSEECLNSVVVKRLK